MKNINSTMKIQRGKIYSSGRPCCGCGKQFNAVDDMQSKQTWYVYVIQRKMTLMSSNTTGGADLVSIQRMSIHNRALTSTNDNEDDQAKRPQPDWRLLFQLLFSRHVHWVLASTSF